VSAALRFTFAALPVAIATCAAVATFLAVYLLHVLLDRHEDDER
jgi:hypothetical protein